MTAMISSSIAQADEQRFIPMEGTLNTRDIGGYPVANGRTVDRGRLYRSANLARISQKDVDTLDAMGIDMVVDFRGPKEAADEPDRLPPGAGYINSPIIGSARGDEIDNEAIAALVHESNLPDSLLDQEAVNRNGPLYRMLYLVNSYGTRDHVERLKGYRALFQTLLTRPADSNILFHCTGGRDRTGVGAALLLKALGVADDVIEADFVASNRYLQPDRDNPDSVRFLDFNSANIFLQPSSNKRYQQVAAQFGTTPERIRGAVELRPELLRRMFRAIDAQYGSFDAFLEKEMGVGAAERARLQSLYTH